MSVFEKIVLPFIDDKIQSIDLTKAAGFVDSYTKDDDRPSAENEFFLVYDADLHNEYTEDRARRFSTSPNLKRTYIKYVNNKPLKIYSFWVNPTISKSYNGIISLSREQKIKVLQFWGFFDSEINTIVDNSVIHTKVEHSIPLEDFVEDFFDYDEGLTIKGKRSIRPSPLFCINGIMNPIHRTFYIKLITIIIIVIIIVVVIIIIVWFRFITFS